MSDKACCACNTVKYDPEEVLTYFTEYKIIPAMRERWTCTTCGANFLRKSIVDYEKTKLGIKIAILYNALRDIIQEDESYYRVGGITAQNALKKFREEDNN